VVALGYGLLNRKSLIYDRDAKFTATFAEVFRSDACGSSAPGSDTEGKRLRRAVRGTVRRECLH